LLGLNAGWAFRQRVALDARALGEAQGLQSFVNTPRDRLEGVRIDDMDRRVLHRGDSKPIDSLLGNLRVWRHRDAVPDDKLPRDARRNARQAHASYTM